MKALKYTFFLLTFALGKADSITQARQELSPSLHIEHLGTPAIPRSFNNALFEQQIQAIDTIGKYGNADDVEILIPYLDYPGPGAFFFSPAESGDEYEKTWPAFGAIARIPHSTEQLYAYALNKNNPIDYRLTVLNMLRYVAPDNFKDCVDKIKETESGNTKLIAYLPLISALQFRGIIHQQALDNWLKDLTMRKDQKPSSNP